MTWKISEIAGNRLAIAFEGNLEAEAGQTSALTFANALGDASRDVVFDVRLMTGYDSEARIAWQQAIGPKRKQIRSIIIVGGRPFVRIGASTMALFLRIPHRFVDDIDQI